MSGRPRGGCLVMALVCTALQLARLATAWDYGNHGNDWGAGWSSCANPGQQSPVDLPQSAKQGTVGAMGEQVYLKYPSLWQVTDVYATDKSVAFTLPSSYRGGFGLGKNGAGEDSLKNSDAEVYRLLQAEFHAPSEHHIGGHRFPLEIQFGHRAAYSGRKAVVSVLFDKGEASEFLQSFIKEGLPNKKWDDAKEAWDSSGLEIPQLFGKQTTFYAYNGSLTQPPCEEGVLWLVQYDVQTASSDQLDKFTGLLKGLSPPDGNARDIPPGTVAAKSAVLVPATSDGSAAGAVPAPVSAAGSSEIGGVDVDEIKQDPQTWVMNPGDPYVVRQAKQAFNNAVLDLQSARVMKSAAKRNLDMANKMYNAAAGAVAAINLKWPVLDKQNLYNEAVARESHAEKTLNEVAREIVELANEGAPPPSKAKKANEFGNGIAEDRRFVAPFHTGDAQNPFIESVNAATQVTVGTGKEQQEREYKRINANLDGPEGGDWSEPVPDLKAKAKAPVSTLEPTTPSPVQIVVEVPVATGNVNEDELGKDLQQASAKGLGAKPGAVTLGEVRRVRL